ncbi:MAG: MCE family protein [Alistipes sp.]|nr:MCE family protein [Alistipes sp.]
MKREAKIGIFGVAMILLAWGGIRFLSGLDVFARNVEYVAAYDQVSGVAEASAVMMKGVKVGTVTAIELSPNLRNEVLLHLTIKREYRIPRNSEARIFSDGLMGGKAIEIVLGDSPEYLERGDTIPSSHTPDLMSMAGSELDFFKNRFAEISDALTRTLNNLNTILEQNAAHLNGTMAHLNTLSGDMADLMGEEKAQLAEMLEGLTTFSTMLGESAPKVDSLLGGVNHLVAQLDEQHFAEELTSTVGNLSALLEKLNEGEGSLGQLLNDKQMYDNLTAASENLSLLLADLKANPARYVHLSVFGKDAEKQKEKAEKRAAKRAEKAEKKAAKAAAKAN